MSLKFKHPTFQQWKADLKAIPESEQTEFIKRTLRHKTMLHVFGRFFFPHIIQGEVEPPESHLELIEFLSSPDSGTAIFPRGFAKSTWEKIDTLHDIVFALEPVVVYISDSLQDAQFHFESIKGELENNEWLRIVFGDLVPQLDQLGVKWKNTHFETTNGINVVARGAGKGRGVNIRNRRPTKVIVDDAETDEQVHSTMRRDKYHRWLYEVIIPSLDKESGRIKMIGTVIHPEAEVLKFYNARGGIFRRAIEEGESIWPEYWTLEDLQRLRDGFTDEEGKHVEGIGVRAFSQEYMNEPINDETAMFKQDWLDRNTWEDLPPLEAMDIKMAVDPNAGLSQMADYMGVVVMGRERRSLKRYVLEARRIKKSIDQQLDDFDAIYDKWHPQIAGIESVLNMTAFYQLALSKNKYRLQKLEPKGRDKVNRAKMVEPLVEQGVVKFHPSHLDLYNEMVQFPNGAHDDLVDAFIYCNSLFEQNTVKLHKEKAAMITAGIRTAKF